MLISPYIFHTLLPQARSELHETLHANSKNYVLIKKQQYIDYNVYFVLVLIHFIHTPVLCYNN